MISEIKTQKQLKDLFNSLYSQGFGFSWAQHEQNALRSKIEKLVHKHNTLDLDCDPSQLRRDLDLDQYNTFAKMEEALKKHFGSFDNKDLIQECLQAAGTPYEQIHFNRRDEPAARDKLLDKLKGYEVSKENDHDGHKPSYLFLHDLTKKTLKINVHNSNQKKVSQLLVLLFPDIKELDIWSVSDYKAALLDNRASLDRQGPKCEFGQWYTRGLMEVRFYKNGSMEIKHPKLMKLKFAYKDYYLTRYGHAVKI